MDRGLFFSMKRILLAFLSAILLTLSFPQFDLWLIAWVSLIPLLLALRNASFAFAFILSFLTGVTFLVATEYEFLSIYKTAWIDWVYYGIILGSFYGFFGLFYNAIIKKSRISAVIAAPILWVTLEYLISHIDFLSYPFDLLGYTQSTNLPIIQISSLTGVYGVSFLMVMVNAALSEVILYFLNKKQGKEINKPVTQLNAVFITILLVTSALLYGFWSLLKQPGTDKVTVAVIQPNVVIDELNQNLLKEIMEKQAQLTKDATSGIKTNLVAWPEGAIMGFIYNDPKLLNLISALAKESNAYFIVGSTRQAKYVHNNIKKKALANSAFLISPKGEVKGQYSKIRLSPFNEYLPYRDFLPWPSRYLKIEDTYVPGTEYKIFDIDGIKFGTTICWENSFPDHFRRFVKKGVNFMVNITNEGRLGETMLYKFLSINILRAVENGVSIVRAANTGITCFIDPYGRVSERVQNHQKETFIEGYLTMEIPLSYKKTFYTIYGDVFAFICIGISIAMIITAFLMKKAV
jgi:apolipoprotein N-acyltransferase